MADKTSKKSAKVAKNAAKRVAAKPPLRAGGNPQIAKADGDALVQAYVGCNTNSDGARGQSGDGLVY